MGMQILGADHPLDDAFAEKLIGPLAKLMTEEGNIPTTPAELRALFRDPNTKIEFPSITISEERMAGVVVRVVRVRVVRVRTAAGGSEFVMLVDESPDELTSDGDKAK